MPIARTWREFRDMGRGVGVATADTTPDTQTRGDTMSDDIVTELRRHAEWAAQGYEVTFSKAADEIERLREALRQRCR